MSTENCFSREAADFKLVGQISHHMVPKLTGPHPQCGWDFPEEILEKFRKDPGNALRAFPGIPVESTAGTNVGLNSRYSKSFLVPELRLKS